MFDEHYEIYLANTPEARRLHYRLRYRVYCLETGFENPDRFQGQRESDEWDLHSVHFLVRERASRGWIGGMRLILPSVRRFPLEHLCNIAPAKVDGLDRGRLAEVSRLCVLRGGRPLQCATAPAEPTSVTRPAARRHESVIVLGLFRAGAVFSEHYGLDHWYSLIRPGLARMMSRLRVPLEPVGLPVDYRGRRHPYVTDVHHANQSMRANVAVWRKLLDTRLPAYRCYSELEGQAQTQAVLAS